MLLVVVRTVGRPAWSAGGDGQFSNVQYGSMENIRTMQKMSIFRVGQSVAIARVEQRKKTIQTGKIHFYGVLISEYGIARSLTLAFFRVRATSNGPVEPP